jgi:5-formyltetrahydrofolate cyclo-ligase
MKTVPSQKTLKSSLRKDMRQKRAGMANDQRQAWDAAINRHLLDYAESTQPRVITAFMAFDGEPDLVPAMTLLNERDVRVALPVVQEEPGRSVISFRQWSPDGELTDNRFGIAEPRGTREIPLAEIDLALVPLVAWDQSGGRLGMGASFYDRLFQPFAGLARPVRMGVGYQLQRTKRIPLEPWDIRMHIMLSELGCLACPE